MRSFGVMGMRHTLAPDHEQEREPLFMHISRLFQYRFLSIKFMYI